MKKISALFLSMLLVAAVSFGATVTTYHVTGPVLEITPDTITVQKGSEKWQIARDASTKIVPDIKVGTKVLITYRMTATSIELPPPSKAKETPKKK
ncbi:MAG: hypothetical protein ACXVH7_11810 [Thermoanaerobaculia bacterium]